MHMSLSDHNTTLCDPPWSADMLYLHQSESCTFRRDVATGVLALTAATQFVGLVLCAQGAPRARSARVRTALLASVVMCSLGISRDLLWILGDDFALTVRVFVVFALQVTSTLVVVDLALEIEAVPLRALARVQPHPWRRQAIRAFQGAVATICVGLTVAGFASGNEDRFNELAFAGFELGTCAVWIILVRSLVDHVELLRALSLVSAHGTRTDRAGAPSGHGARSTEGSGASGESKVRVVVDKLRKRRNFNIVNNVVFAVQFAALLILYVVFHGTVPYLWVILLITNVSAAPFGILLWHFLVSNTSTANIGSRGGGTLSDERHPRGTGPLATAPLGHGPQAQDKPLASVSLRPSSIAPSEAEASMALPSPDDPEYDATQAGLDS